MPQAPLWLRHEERNPFTSHAFLELFELAVILRACHTGTNGDRFLHRHCRFLVETAPPSAHPRVGAVPVQAEQAPSRARIIS